MARGRFRLSFYLLAALLGLLIGLAVLEGLCRLLPAARPPEFWPSPLEYQQIPETWFKQKRLADGTWLACNCSFRPWAVPRDKAPGALRIAAYGGSATNGLGYAPGGAFPELLEQLLAERHPERAIEVLNLSSVGFSSSQVLVMVRQALQNLDPDLLLIYSGNNELLDFQGLHNALCWSGRRIRGRYWLREHSAFYRGLARLAGRAHSERIVGGEVAECGSFVPDADDWMFARRRYRSNLDAICSAARESGVDVLLSTVAGNAEVSMRLDRCFFCDSWISGEPGIDADWRLDQAFALVDHGRPEQAAALLSGIEGQDADLIRALISAARGDAAAAAAQAGVAADQLAIDDAYRGSPILWARYLQALRLCGRQQELAAAYAGLREFALSPDFPNWERVYFLYRIGALAGDELTWRRASTEFMSDPSYFLTATPAANAVVEAAARDNDALLLRLDQALTGHTGSDHVGYDLLLDYCHFNYRGAWLVAAAVAQAIEQRGLLEPLGPEQDVWAQAEQRAGEPWQLGHDHAALGRWIGVNRDLCALVHRMPTLEQREQRVRSAVEQGSIDPLDLLWDLHRQAALDPRRELMIEYQRLHRRFPELDGVQQSAELCDRWSIEPLIPENSLDQ